MQSNAQQQPLLVCRETLDVRITCRCDSFCQGANDVACRRDGA
jgi:hypothetical protein